MPVRMLCGSPLLGATYVSPQEGREPFLRAQRTARAHARRPDHALALDFAVAFVEAAPPFARAAFASLCSGLFRRFAFAAATSWERRSPDRRFCASYCSSNLAGTAGLRTGAVGVGVEFGSAKTKQASAEIQASV